MFSVSRILSQSDLVNEAVMYWTTLILYRTEITRNQEGVSSAIIETMLTYFGKTAVQGAQTTLHCCLTDAAFLRPGGFYVDCEETETQGDQRGWYTVSQQTKLCQISNKMLAI